ncbi:Nucleic acid-binding OB-fold-containing protein [Penicillium alfredii]|uniref:Replication protein A subunit n=1 Tax=Penicillium alfredii TaxID=1506179 RepID=A0A9W9FK92_9EURO|nr:Nucleic acid-binding OB-fold-containing protein [Penicillium alfredii]KAJ5101467.1 Nucleic acid-binding OB-fold-containing protein [Penicillium alfredii]
MASDAASQVSVGALSAIFDDNKAQIHDPIVQCVQIKPLPPQPNHPERYRAVFSDIANYVQTMLATPEANHVVSDGSLRKGCFVRLKSFQANSVKGKKILIILDLEVLRELGESEKIGEPKPLESKPDEEETNQPTTISTNGFYGSKIQGAQPQPNPRAQPMRAPAASAHATIYPIEAISPYSNKWTIKARCTSKSNIKTWHNKNGEGKLFSVNLLDDSGEIRATGFNDQCDMLFDLFQEGSVYYISSPCRVQIAKKQFTNLNSDYELTFERDTLVEKTEEQNDVPQIRFNFTTIGDLQSVEKNTTTDVIGVLQDVGNASQIVSQATKKPYDKRELTLVDNTGFSVRLTVWGATANNFNVMPESVVAFKGVKVSDFGGRSLSLLSSGSMTVDPDIGEAHRLKGWYDAQGRSENFTSHASVSTAADSTGRGDRFKTVAQVREEQLGMSEQPDYFSLKATVVYIRQRQDSTWCYPACISEGCNKKVTELDPGQWRCEKCDRTHSRPEYRFILPLSVSDHTGQLWLSCFDDTGRLVMGTSADHLMQLRDEDPTGFDEAFQEANCQTWNFRCRAKIDNFGEQQRVRYQVSSAKPVNYSEEASRLADIISSYRMVTHHHEAAELHPKKKSKSEKHAKSTKDKTSKKQEVEDLAQDSGSYSQSRALTELPQSDIDQFLSDKSIKITDPLPEAPSLRPMISFDYLPTCEGGLYAQLKSFSSPTPIQSATWPLLFAGRDVIGIAETGSGKTLAFGLPCLKKLMDSKRSKKPCQPTAVIISPTRELAMQIYDQLVKFSESGRTDVACIYGGVKKDEQREALKKAAIVVATPGRLKDLQNDGSINLGKVKYLVLDEADRMLDKGFEQDIKDIIQPMPVSRRQTVMFTATWPRSVRELAATFMSSPVTVTIGGDPSADPRANTRIKQVVEGGSQSPEKVLVFCLYKKEAMRVEKLIKTKGFKVAGIHGDLNQSDRFRNLEAFKTGASTVLVATDVAARGLDIPAVKLVINATFPLTVEDYVHRIGRTGRAGAEGHAITLFTENDKALSGGLVNVLKAAKQEVPEALLKFGTTVKKKQHDAYGAFFKDVDTDKAATKIVFDD